MNYSKIQGVVILEIFKDSLEVLNECSRFFKDPRALLR